MKLQVARTFHLELTENEAERLCAFLGVVADWKPGGLGDMFVVLAESLPNRVKSFSDYFEAHADGDRVLHFEVRSK